MEFDKIIEELKSISVVSTFKNESWSSLALCGEYSVGYSKSYFSQLYDIFSALGISNAITLYIDSEAYSIDEFIETLSNGDNWRIHINKTVWLNKLDANGIVHTFFLFKNEFLNWAKDTDPFMPDNPFNENRTHIYVLDLEESFGGPNFYVNNSDDTENWISDINIPTALIESTIRIRCHEEFIIAPQKHIVTIGCVTDNSKYFYRNAISVLLASLCDEILSDGIVIIRGHRILKVKLGCNIFSKEELFNYQITLISIVQWIFEKEDNCSVKKNLFTDRVSLDIESCTDLYNGLKIGINNIESQIKEQYNFILLERKTAYQSELKNLLNDIKSITDAFSDKVRSILGNLLRDVLAALVLVGITLFSQVEDIKNLSDNNLINYVFDAFGIYFLSSIILQGVFDYMDIMKSVKDLEYWKDITHNYISKSQFDIYKKKTLGKRFKQMIAYYIVIALFYIGISITCFNYSSICSKFITQSHHKIEHNQQKGISTQEVFNNDSIINSRFRNDTVIRSNNK